MVSKELFSIHGITVVDGKLHRCKWRVPTTYLGIKRLEDKVVKLKYSNKESNFYIAETYRIHINTTEYLDVFYNKEFINRLYDIKDDILVITGVKDDNLSYYLISDHNDYSNLIDELIK